MLGPPKPRRLDEPIAVSLEALIPRDHFYRHVEAKLDLSFVRDWTRELYAERGRPSIDPVVFFKLQLVMFFEDLRSERTLIETALLNLAHRWYLGYALDEPLPDHSSLTRIRQRLGIDIFQYFFEKVVDLCQEAGLVWGWELYVDATKVEANADLDSLVPRFCHVAKTHVADLFTEDVPTDAAQGEPETVVSALPASVVRLPNAARDEVGRADPPPWKLLEERRLDPNRPAVGSYLRTSDFRVSTTDPDATPMRMGTGTSLGYHDHYVVDGGKRRIILAALVTPADVMESEPLRDLLRRVCFRRKMRPGQVIGDTAYGTIENIVALEDAGIRAFFPLPDFDRRTPFLGKGEFTYDAAADTYRCPQGQVLRRRKTKYTEDKVVYRAKAATCNACPAKTQCTASDHGRIVHRSFSEEYLNKVRDYHMTEAYQKAMRKRKVWVEAALRRSQGVAWLTPTPAPGPTQRQHSGTVDRSRAEPEALLGRDGLGPASCSLWPPRGPLPRGRTAGSLLLLISPADRVLHSPASTHLRTSEPAILLNAFFNTQRRYRNQVVCFSA